VDDDNDALQMAKDVLTLAGAEVFTTGSAADAQTELDARKVDVTVVDIRMPQMDGYQLLNRIRQGSTPRQGKVPAIALTAYARAVDRTRSVKAGLLMHLTKPVQPGELAAAVRALARETRPSQDPPDSA
jgi:DNA-binding response OmpR family regulator